MGVLGTVMLCRDGEDAESPGDVSRLLSAI